MAFAAPKSLPEPNAKADADPAVLGSYTHALHYPAYYTQTHYTYPYYGYHVGKRSAEPESAPLATPESKADPAYYYGYYGHPYTYRYPYYRHFGKRSADAEPESKPEGKADPYYLYYGHYPYYYGGYYGYPYGYYYGK